MNSENKNLAGEKSKTVDPERYRQALISAHQNFIGLCWNQKLVDEFARLEEGSTMPIDPQDVLELLGNIEPLKLAEADKEDARRTIRRLLREQSPEWVWESRLRLKLEIDFAVHWW